MSQAPPHFVSQADLTDAQKRREREIQEAYARIGEEPPPKPAEEAYDPRPLYERLREARALQDERIEEMFKLRNQFRGLDESESQFLADIEQARKHREQEKRQQDAKELDEFRRATESKSSAPPPLPERTALPTIPKAKPRAGSKRKREQASALGIVPRKSTQPSASASCKNDPSSCTISYVPTRKKRNKSVHKGCCRSLPSWGRGKKNQTDPNQARTGDFGVTLTY